MQSYTAFKRLLFGILVSLSGLLTNAQNVSLSISDASILEAGGVATLTATSDIISLSDITVNLSFSGTATNGTDYTSDNTIIIPAGANNGTTDITAQEDTQNELEESIIIDISSVVNGTENGTQQASTVITDNDPEPTVSISANPVSFGENGDSSTITATLSNSTYQPITVTIEAVNGTASDADYDLTSTEITIAAGELTGTTSISGSDDGISEGSETLSIDITAVSAGATEDGTQTQPLTITDDDGIPTVAISASPTSFSENGGSSIITATLSGVASQPITVTIEAVNGTASDADYDLTSTEITIAAGATTGTTSISGSDDGISEGSETLSIDITGVSAGATEDGTQTQPLTITDDDGIPTVAISASPTSFSENGGSSTITATLSGETSQPITVTIEAVNGTASDADYDLTSTEITIAAGATTGTTSISGSDDGISEGSETLSIDITAVSAGATEDGTQSQPLTITDDDGIPTVAISASPTSFSENGGSSTITATLSGVASQPITVTIEAVNGTASGADYDLTSTEITIAAGATTGTTSISGSDDGISEGSETLSIDITGVSAGATEDGTQTQPLTITDDDGIPTVAISASPTSFSENGGSSIITATLSGVASQPITVTIEAVNGTASNADYDLTSTEITIAAGELTGTTSISGSDDGISEGSETLSIDITAVSAGATEDGTQSQPLTITDDEGTPTVAISASPASFSENGASSIITATLSGETSQPITVTIEAVNGTASDADYNLTSTEITIAAGATTGTTSISGSDDGISEGSETLSIDITAVSAGATEDGTQSQPLTITDDEGTPTVAISASPTSFSENGGSSTITATLSGETSQPITVTIEAVNGTASGADYDLTSTEITIAAGATTGTTSISGSDDGISEGSETLSIDITGVSAGATEDGTQSQPLTITDDDGIPTVAISANPTSFSENGGSSIITATLSGETSQPITVTIEAVNGTASDADYDLTSTEITIAAGELTGTTSISGSDDGISEGSETLSIDITAVSAGATEDGTQSQPLTITDDDGIPTVAISASPTSFSENGGSSIITATLSGETSQPITVTIEAVNGTASDADYDLTSTEITIAAGELTGTTSISGSDDGISEGSETLSIDITAVSAGATEDGTQSQPLTITDDEGTPTVAISANPTSFSENGGSSTITATLSGVASQPITVTIEAVNGTASNADYDLTSTEITIAAGATTGTTSISGSDDGISEGSETLSIDITGISAGATEDGEQSQSLTITDDEGTPTVAISASPTSFSENGGASIITATLSGETSQPITVTIEAVNGTASDADYDLTSTEITIAAGELTGTTSISGVNDEISEGSETLSIDITGVSAGASEDGTQSQPLTITDDDGIPTVAISASPTSFSENGGASTITATLSGETSQPITVTIEAVNGTASNADYDLTSTEITIAAGELTGTTSISGSDDGISEGSETLSIDITGISAGATEDGEQSQSLTITDDEGTPTVAISASPTSFSENGGASIITATLSGETSQPITVTIEAVNGTASDADYDLTSTEITIAAGELTGTTSISGVNDEISEGSETLSIDITGVSAGASEDGTQSQPLTITDDDGIPTVAISANPTSFSENSGSSTITATLSGVASQPITVTIEAVNGTASDADYDLTSTEITIAAGELTGTTSISGSDDGISEGSETLSIHITAVSAGAIEDGTQSQLLTITDDEGTPTVSLTASPNSINEGASTTITATLSTAASEEVIITLSVTDNETETTDYSLEPTTINIPAGSLSEDAVLSSTNDDMFEADESLDVSISNVSGGSASFGTPSSQTITIINNDPAPTVSLSAGTNPFDEGSNTIITAELTNPTEDNVTVTLLTTDNSTETGDYSLSSSTITITGGQLSGTTTINGATDNLYEGDETFDVAISDISGGSVSEGTNNSVSLTITDLQSPPTVTLEANPLTIGEDGTSTITARADVATEEGISVTIEAVNVSTDNQDYDLTSTSIAISAEETEGSTTLEGVSDETYEGDEEVSISITALDEESAQIGDPQSVTITISDDQTAPTVTLSASPVEFNEGLSSTITATLNTAAAEDVTVTLSVTDIDTSSEDYSLSSTTIVVPSGSIESSVTLSTVADEIYEGNESLSLAISGVDGGSATLGASTSVTLTINDDEAAPLVTISADPQTIGEGTSTTISVILSTATDQDVSVSLGAVNSTAASNDYTLNANTITILAGNLNASSTLDAADDAIFEGNESLSLEITDVTGGSATEDGDQSVSISIEDNETAPVVSLSASPLNIPEDGTSTLTAILTTLTDQDVTVTVALSNGSIENEDLYLSSNTIVIPAGEPSGELTIQGVSDNIFEGNETFDIEITTTSGGGSTEDGDQSVTIILDDDELPPAVTLSASPLSIPEDGSSVLTISLSNPTFEDVLVNLNVTGGSAGVNDFNLTSGSVTIPAGNISATARLDGLPDALYEGNEDVSIEITAVGGGSATEDGTQSASISIEDAQTIPLASLELTGSPFSEDAGTANLIVRLNHASVENVQIELLFDGTASTSDYSGATSSVEIPAFSTETTISLTGVDDQEAEGEESILVSIESVTNGVEDGNQAVNATILDDDVVGIKPAITGGSTITSEAGTFDNFNVMLNTQPASDVVIDITGVDNSEGTISPSTLTFTPDNWNENQIVTVTGVDDNEVDGDISYSLTLEVVNNSSDQAYRNVSTTVGVTNTDNDAAGFTLGITNSGTHTTESGDSDVFSLVLNSQPTSDVVFIISGLDTTEGTLSTDEVVFTSANWNQLQNITITGVDDDLVDGDITYTLTVLVNDAQSDATYHGQSQTLEVVNGDDDSAGISVSTSGDNTQTSEDGTTDSFEVVLDSQPESDVVIGLSGLDVSEAVLSSTQLTFTPENWSQPQSISLTGIDDDMVDGNISYTLTLAVDDALSDPGYSGQSVSITSTNTDNDVAGIAISESEGNTVTSEDGSSDSFDVSLTSHPESYVVIDIIGLDSSEGSLESNELIFSPANWNQVQTVTVTGVDDEIMDGDISYTLNLSVDYDNSDDTYDGITESVEIINTDNETENQSPTPVADEFSMDEGTILQGSSLLANDSDPDGDEININLSPVIAPTHGSLDIFSDGTFTYQPDDGFTGSDSFEYEICDSRSSQICATATVTITVLEVDPDPDNDGIPTDKEGDGDADNDGIPNYLDPDSDNDGIPDAEEPDFDCDNDGVTDRLDPDPCFKVKEAFSPNNDGINDGFVIPWTSQYDKVSLVIFNRWGSIVFSSDNYQNDWTGEASSGISKGKGLPVGTYYYVVTIHDINKRISGYFYLNR
ncbi:Calx-beta domain-containing protein [Marinilabilia rubra]|uniref:Calx-beta domain-containing protein n=1 Tax=Marinilabilia rubra TaxID=2162893 RepID=A0A2U2BB73_9BACT|nr:Calx-beta domain-containing protein [Marinilabilia rubra]PWE00287.1 hypothetical protein DDZ16_04925 [Marinilabilia rubra]